MGGMGSDYRWQFLKNTNHYTFIIFRYLKSTLDGNRTHIFGLGNQRSIR